MAITISTHLGSTVDLAHNLREKWRIEEENRKWAEKHPGELRIDLSKEHKILVYNGTLSQVYHRLFDEALKEYNEKVMKAGNTSRVIKNYLGDIRAKEGKSKGAKHPVYELITTVGSKENPIDEETAKRILLEHAAGFRERNPHLYLVSQVLHADEVSGGAPCIHVHHTWVPEATGQKRGLKVQNSLTAALKQQGIYGDKYHHTAQMIWEKRENEALEAICKKYGFEVEHPQAGTKQTHLSIEEYKLTKEIEKKRQELESTAKLPLGKVLVSKGRLEELEGIERNYKRDLPKIDRATRDLSAAAESMEAYVRAYERLQKEKTDFDKTLNSLANRKIGNIKEKALEFIKKNGMWDKFSEWSIEARGIKR